MCISVGDVLYISKYLISLTLGCNNIEPVPCIVPLTSSEPEILTLLFAINKPSTVNEPVT
jgi:hypothetical protein